METSSFLNKLIGQRLTSVKFEQAQYDSLSPSHESLTVRCIHLAFDDYGLSIFNPVRLGNSSALMDQREDGFEGALCSLVNHSICGVVGDNKSLSFDFDNGMHMTEMLLRFFEFDEWANHETLLSLETMTNSPERALALIAHIAATQRVWLERALSMPQSVAVWPTWSLSQTAKELSRVLGEWTRVIATDDLSREFAYRNTKGQQFRNKLSDVALHVAFHGVYHRGQIAALVRKHGGELAYTDFIQAVMTGSS